MAKKRDGAERVEEVHRTFRLNAEVSQRLDKFCGDRKAERKAPWTAKDVLGDALDQYLKRRGY